MVAAKLLPWACRASSPRREQVENKCLLCLHGDWAISLAMGRSRVKGSTAGEVSICGADGGAGGRVKSERVTACWLRTPLEEATDRATCDLPAESQQVRQGDSSPVLLDFERPVAPGLE